MQEQNNTTFPVQSSASVSADETVQNLDVKHANQRICKAEINPLVDMGRSSEHYNILFIQEQMNLAAANGANNAAAPSSNMRDSLVSAEATSSTSSSVAPLERVLFQITSSSQYSAVEHQIRSAASSSNTQLAPEIARNSVANNANNVPTRALRFETKDSKKTPHKHHILIYGVDGKLSKKYKVRAFNADTKRSMDKLAERLAMNAAALPKRAP